MSPELKIQGQDIVLRGNFSPIMFHPLWLSQHGLLSEKEAAAADIKILHPSGTYIIADWLVLEVTDDRFHVATVQESYYEALRDLTVGIIQILGDFVIISMGINFTFHFGQYEEKIWNEIGHQLAPPSNWEGLLDKPGMQNLTMRGVRPDGLSGFIQTAVEPSTRVQRGLLVQVNDHYMFANGNQKKRETGRVAQTLKESWAISMERSQRIAQSLANLRNEK
jgi:hypothetical protein